VTTRRIVKKPAPKMPRQAPPDMIRDKNIASLGTLAVSQNALVACVIYETAGNVVLAVPHDGSKATLHGLLRKACEAEGIGLA